MALRHRHLLIQEPQNQLQLPHIHAVVQIKVQLQIQGQEVRQDVPQLVISVFIPEKQASVHPQHPKPQLFCADPQVFVLNAVTVAAAVDLHLLIPLEYRFLGPGRPVDGYGLKLIRRTAGKILYDRFVEEPHFDRLVHDRLFLILLPIFQGRHVEDLFERTR